MSNEKNIKPDIVLELTRGQIDQIKPLRQKQAEFGNGMILGSVGCDNDGMTIGLSYIPREIAMRIIELATQELGEKTDVNS